MAGRTLIDGVYKRIKGGNMLVNGVGKKVKCGEVLINGVAHKIGFDQTVTIPGQPYGTYAYVTYSGGTIRNTGTIEVPSGDYVTVHVKADNWQYGSYAKIKHNGTVVASGGSSDTNANYSFAPTKAATIRFYKSYDNSPYTAYAAEITGG